MVRIGKIAAKVALVALVMVVAAGIARTQYTDRWHETDGTVTRAYGHGVHEVAFTTSDDVTRSAIVRPEPGVEDRAVLDVGQVVPVVASRSTDEVHLGTPTPGFDLLTLALGFLLAIATAIVLLSPEFVHARRPEDVLESNGFYWRS